MNKNFQTPKGNTAGRVLRILKSNTDSPALGLMQRLGLSVLPCSRFSLHLRRSSTLTNAAFTSFFFHNAQWTPLNAHGSRTSAALSVDHQRLSPAASPIPPFTAYKPAEVLTPKRLLKVYSQLAKSRLTFLVVLTAMSGVAMSPLPTTIPILLSTAIGTALCSTSANTLNQLQEVPYDAQMARTRMRPLVRRAISPLHAASFAVATGVAGPVLLWTMVNPTTALIGLGNIALYAGAYTWSKRRTFWNTWIGAIVGALPPLMGWTACGGKLFPSIDYPIHLFSPSLLTDISQSVDLSLIDNPLSPLALFILHFSWQFPHFNSLSHLVRGSYAQAGYRMLSVLSPSKNALVSLRHAILLVPICSLLVPLSGLTTWLFALTSLLPNAICIGAAWRFWRFGGEKEARVVFQHSLWYLPVVLGLMMVHKQGTDWLQWLGLRERTDVEKSSDSASQN
ncbi:protoheme IX farnesyltransferase [Pluteus cervinus]|uniref:Protoheme IX farnesyltransferase n=1 Tax=Pluteus cervinus TaxID=181527 RepID=A0ACD3AY55_9AGAR|nr:protoheme IX farnesyltransferase [Pluteus cervinus]